MPRDRKPKPRYNHTVRISFVGNHNPVREHIADFQTYASAALAEKCCRQLNFLAAEGKGHEPGLTITKAWIEVSPKPEPISIKLPKRAPTEAELNQIRWDYLQREFYERFFASCRKP
jgi:hypothetical protein